MNKMPTLQTKTISMSNQLYQLLQVTMMQAFWGRYNFYLTYFPLVIGIATAFVYFEQNYLLVNLSAQTYFLATSLNILNFSLFVLSYVQAIRVKTTLPKEVPFPRVKNQLRNNHPYYIYHNKCEKDEDRYKPNRTSHCSKDGCVVRFDHHCALTANCVGHRNLKINILLTFYGTVLFLQFFIVSIQNYIQITRNGVNPMGQNEVSLWMLFTFLAFFFIISLAGLTFSGLKLASKNVTYIDLLKGNFTLNDKDGTNPNPFDLQCITNFATIFEGERWTFWLPTAGNIRYDGTKYPMVPPITDADKKTLFENVQQYLKDPIQKSVPKTFEQLYEKEYLKYEDTIFQYMGEQYNLQGVIQKPKASPRGNEPLEKKESLLQAEIEEKEAEDILANVYGEAEI